MPRAAHISTVVLHWDLIKHRATHMHRFLRIFRPQKMYIMYRTFVWDSGMQGATYMHKQQSIITRKGGPVVSTNQSLCRKKREHWTASSPLPFTSWFREGPYLYLFFRIRVRVLGQGSGKQRTNYLKKEGNMPSHHHYCCFMSLYCVWRLPQPLFSLGFRYTMWGIYVQHNNPLSLAYFDSKENST
jgi:hypothetical protein